jgi:hypothetical protein
MGGDGSRNPVERGVVDRLGFRFVGNDAATEFQNG